jgi:hypothetical protein
MSSQFDPICRRLSRCCRLPALQYLFSRCSGWLWKPLFAVAILATVSPANGVAQTTITSRSVPIAGTYAIGQSLDVTATFSAAVTVTGIPRVPINIGGTTYYADYVSGSASTTLVFRYTVAGGEVDSNGVEIGEIQLNGGTIQDATPAAATISGTFGSTPTVLVDGVRPTATITLVDQSPTGLPIRNNVRFLITFSESVTFGGANYLVTPGGSANWSSTSLTGSGSSYTVLVSDLGGTGTVNFVLQNVGSIVDSAGNALTVVPPPEQYLVDNTQPVVTSVLVPAAATYTYNSIIGFTVVWNESVNITGTPVLQIDIGGVVRNALYVSQGAGNQATFQYTIQSGEEDNNGISIISLIQSNGSTIKDAVGNNADLTLAGVGPTGSVLVDATRPTAASTSVPPSATHILGQNLDFTITFSEAVTVGGAGFPSVNFSLDTGGNVSAAYVSGSGTNTFLFRRIVGAGEADTNGITVSGLALNGGTLRDAAGNDADLTTINFGPTNAVLVDGIVPVVASINPAAATPTNATSVTFTVTFNEGVTGVDLSDFALTTTGTAGGTIASVVATSSSVYTVTVNTVSGDGTLRLDLNPAATGILDLNGNAISAGFNAGNTYTIDSTVPTVASVGVPGNSTYVATNTLMFAVNFSENVLVASGTPSLSLTIGSTTRSALYSSGSGTAGLIFTYTIVAGELDTDGITVGALSLNGATINDSAGNAANLTLNAVGATAGVLVDAVPPTVASSSVPNSTTHIIGQNLDFTVTFSENVTVTGTPTVNFTLNTGGAVSASYVSGSGGTTLLFRRAVLAGEADPDGITVTGLGLVAATIKDAANNNADIAGLSFGSTANVLVDGIVPTVASINPVNAGPTNATTATFTVTFNEGVSGVDASDFTLTTTGTAAGTIASVAATSSSVYTVTVNTVAGDGTLRLDLNNAGTSIIDLAGNAITAGFNAGNTVTVDNSVPVISSVAVPANATYVAAQTLTFTVNFGENVTVNTAGGTPTLGLTIGTSSKSASYTGGSGTTALTFAYTITAGDLDTDGIAVGALALNGGTIIDAGSNNANLTLNNVGATGSVLVDAVAPTVASATVPTNGTYIVGQNLDFTVTYSEIVNVTGTPSIAVTLNTGGTVQANYSSGTGTATLTFRRTVVAGDADTDGVAVAGSIALNGGTIADAANNAAATAVTFGATTGVLVDAVAPTVASIVPGNAGPSNATSVTFTVTFNEGVSGVDASDFTLTTTGTAAGTIASVAATSTSVYTVTVNTVGGDGTLRLDLNIAATGIADLATNAIVGGYSAGQTFTVDNTAPVISSVAVPANATYVAGQTLTFTVNFGENVTVNTAGGTPTLGLTIGTSSKSASFTGGSGTTALTFAYTITAGDLDTDGIAVGALALNGGTIADAASNNANLTLNNVGATGSVLVDAVAPTVASATVPANGTYIVGQNLDFTVTYSEIVNVTGTPSIAVTLNTGGTVQANYSSGTGTATLTFRRTVVAGDADTDGVAVAGSIALNGGTIADAANNAAATAVTFGATTGVLVDAVAPTVASITRAGSSPTNAASIVFNVTFSEAVTGVDVSDFVLTTTGASGAIASISATSTSVYAVTVNTVAGNGTLRLDLNNSGTGIADLATNVIAGGYTAGQTYTIDTTAPTVASVAVPANATYISGQNLTFTVNLSEMVTVDTTGGTPGIALTIGSATKSAAYTGGSGTASLTFAYTVTSGDLDSDGIAVGALALNGGTIVDAANNSANLTLNAVAATTGVLVDAVAPTVASSTIPASNTYIVGQHLDFTVTFSENVVVTGTPSVAVTLNTGGTVQANYLSGTGTATLTFRRTVVATELDSDGVAVSSVIGLNGGTILDAAGNAADSSGLAFAATTGVKVDGVAPTVVSIARAEPVATGLNLTYIVTFSESVANVDAADFSLTGTDSASGTISSVTATNTLVYSVAVSATGSGTLRLDLKNVTNITDSAGNAISGGFQSGEAYSLDSTAPTLATLIRHLPNTVDTTASSVIWRAIFSESVTGVDIGDFVLVRNGANGSNTVPSATIASVSGSGSIYEIEVNGISGVGTVQLNLKSANTGIADLANNALATGIVEGQYYAVGASSVLDTTVLAQAGTRSVSTLETLAQRFTTGANAPLTIRSISALIDGTTGSPNARVQIRLDNNGALGALVTESGLLNVVANSLNTWNLTLSTLNPNTTYWIVFKTETQGGSYNVRYSAATTGGAGSWLTNADYTYLFGNNPAFAGVVQIAFGAGSVPTINSPLIASGTYGSPIVAYTITATGSPTSYAASNLPPGLSVNTQTGVISGTPTAAGSYNVSVTASNENGAGSPAVVAFTVAKVPLTVRANNQTRTYATANPTLTVEYSGFVLGNTAQNLTTAPTATTSATLVSQPGTYSIVPAGGVSSNYTFNYVNGTLTVLSGGGGGGGGGGIAVTPTKATATVTLGNLTQTYNASARAATATTSPAGLTVRLTYNGSSSAPVDAGSYSVSASIDDANYQGTATGTLTVAKASQTINFPAVSLGSAGSTITLGATASSGLPVAYSIVSGNATLVGSTLRFTDGSPVTVRATQAGNTNYNAVSSDQSIGGSTKLEQTITFAALADRESTSGAFTLSATASSGLAVSFQITSGPATLSGNTVTLTGDAGVVTITAAQAGNSTYAAAPSVTRSFTVTGGKVLARLVNLSILTGIDTAGDSFTLGYVLGGRGTSGSKNVLIRAVGPTLGTAFNLTGALSDPKIELYAGRVKSGENDNWGGTAALNTAFTAVGAFPWANASSLDAASVATVSLGDNSVVVSGNGNARGSVLAELYDTTPLAQVTASTPRFVNVSVLKNLGTGLTAGFVIDGTGSKRVLIRAVGPTIGAAPFNVAGAVADPQLTLYSGQTVVRSNDNWGGTAELTAAFAQVGAFALPATSRDAAIAVTLEPGAYSVQVTGVSNSTGIALVEVYEIPE